MALVEPNVQTLLKWAARDSDRTMVFGAELNIELEQVTSQQKIRRSEGTDRRVILLVF